MFGGVNMLESKMNKKTYEAEMLDMALNSFRDANGIDFYDMLTNESIRNESIRRNSENVSTDYINERKEIMSDIQSIQNYIFSDDIKLEKNNILKEEM